MPQLTYFLQTCPTCGRASQVRVEYLGTTVSCRHCGGAFPASGDNADEGHGPVRKGAVGEVDSLHRESTGKKPR